MITLAANAALWLSSARQYQHWKRATERVAETQRSVLFKILKNNANTVFGVEHGFPKISSVSDYRRSVPLCSYEDLQPYIQRIAAGENNLLTAEKVDMFAPTSGSTSASKLIPYTNSLKKEFQLGIGPWFFAAYARWPKLLAGKQYWSITPVGAEESSTPGGIPIGFEEDSEYLSGLDQRIIRQLMVVPPVVHRIQERETFRYVTLRFLLQCREISLLSIWNPTFLLLLLEALPHQATALLSDLANGTLVAPGPIEPYLALELRTFLKRDPGRAKALASLLNAWNGNPQWRDERGRSVYEAIWPRLALISCWTDANAGEYATTLQRLFPNTPLQPKGLLATEGIVSFPLGDRAGGALSLNSHFFEFVPSSSGNNPDSVRLAHELVPGEAYSVVVTTGGGLYRYRMHDLVEVTGFTGDCPVFRFLGKQDSVVDLFGEKLNEGHVRQLVTEQLARHRMSPVFWLLAPEKDGHHSAHYTLFLQWQPSSESIYFEEALRELAADVEDGLQQNYHYRYCRQLGQLEPAKVFLISDQAGNAYNRFLETCSSLGHRLGDIKPTALHRYAGWGTVFPGRYLQV